MRQHNRASRRQLKRLAPSVAKLWAESCLPCSPNGAMDAIRHPTAIRILERAFRHLLKNGLEPHTVKLTPSQMEAFPGVQPRIADLNKATPYLAVGVDVGGRGTYSIRWISTPGVEPLVAEQMNRLAAVQCLEPHLQTSGFTVTPGTDARESMRHSP